MKGNFFVVGLAILLIGCTSRSAKPLIKTTPITVSAAANTAPRTFEIPINPMMSLSFLSKAQVYQLRINAVHQHPELLNDGSSYQPSEEIFGQITDGKPWWGIYGLSYYGPGQQSIEGVSFQSQFLLNPFLLIGLQDRFAHEVNGHVDFPAIAVYPEPVRLVWDLNERQVQITYNVTNFANGLHAIRSDYADEPKMTFNAYNAKDMGFPYFYLVRESSSHVIPEDANSTVVQIPQFIHTGGSCGYPGGCNNMSPSFPPLDFKVDALPAAAAIKLWRRQPKDPSADADLTVILTMQ